MPTYNIEVSKSLHKKIAFAALKAELDRKKWILEALEKAVKK